MVYQFSLPPLLLHALHTGNSHYLTEWAQAIPDQSPMGTYFNFTASHDGIGVRPLEGLMPGEEMAALLNKMKEFGAMISERANPDGSTSPYEINISLFDALRGTQAGPDSFQVPRFLCSQIVMMTLQGMPAFYIHSLLGTENDYEGVRRTGRARSINRKKWPAEELMQRLRDETHHAHVFRELRRLIRIRTQQPAFHPNASQQILDWGESLFVVKREAEEAGQKILAVSNLTAHPQKITIGETDVLEDLISGRKQIPGELELSPYQTVWLASSP